MRCRIVALSSASWRPSDSTDGNVRSSRIFSNNSTRSVRPYKSPSNPNKCVSNSRRIPPQIRHGIVNSSVDRNTRTIDSIGCAPIVGHLNVSGRKAQRMPQPTPVHDCTRNRPTGFHTPRRQALCNRAIGVCDPTVGSPISTSSSLSFGTSTSTRDPNLMNPHTLFCSTRSPGFI